MIWNGKRISWDTPHGDDSFRLYGIWLGMSDVKSIHFGEHQSKFFYEMKKLRFLWDVKI